MHALGMYPGTCQSQSTQTAQRTFSTINFGQAANYPSKRRPDGRCAIFALHARLVDQRGAGDNTRNAQRRVPRS
eukprot:2458580-Prymnesium_polylepis.1